MRTKPPLPIRILTHNIRYAADPPATGEEKWEVRRSLLNSHFAYHITNVGASFLCLQEVLERQLHDVLDFLNQGSDHSPWTYIGVGRDDGRAAGEFAPILYRPTEWKRISWKTYWLSESGQVGSKGWDAASVRICTVAAFRHWVSGKSIVLLNTHLDDQGRNARRGAAFIVRHRAEEWSKCYGAPIVVTGDLNSEPGGEAHRILNDHQAACGTIDAESVALLKYGDRETFTGFEDKEEEKQQLDFIFIGPSSQVEEIWRVKQYSVLPNQFEDGVYHSDHRAVVADVELS